MPSFKTLDEAARLGKVSRRLIQRWLSEGRLTAYRIPGDRRRYVDFDELKELRQPRPVEKES